MPLATLSPAFFERTYVENRDDKPLVRSAFPAVRDDAQQMPNVGPGLDGLHRGLPSVLHERKILLKRLDN
jgi:hypothetical protein